MVADVVMGYPLKTRVESRSMQSPSLCKCADANQRPFCGKEHPTRDIPGMEDRPSEAWEYSFGNI
jgi:CDGSH-type Zn-finger protein